MKYSLVFALAFLVTACSSQDVTTNDGSVGGFFDMANIIKRVRDLFKFRQLVLEQVAANKLTLDELKDPIQNAVKKGVECFKDQLINFKEPITALLSEFQKMISNIHTGLEPTEGAMANPAEALKIIVGLVSKFTEIWNSPEAKNILNEFVEDLKVSGKAAEECFKTSLQGDLPEKYDLLRDLWNQSRQVS